MKTLARMALHRRLSAGTRSAVPLLFLLCVPAAEQISAQAIQTVEDPYEALKEIAIIEEMVMVPMRDGVRLATHIYRPKDSDGNPVPTVFVKTPYNMNLWSDGELNTGRFRAPLEAVRRGYAYVNQNERGKFFSEGEWDILGPPKTDGYDALSWIASQPWSNGKVGTQ
ncbi:CocE/NonD family hydrolase, partial [Gemmatimonadota bacterium]